MGFFDKVRDVLTSSDAQRARNAREAADRSTADAQARPADSPEVAAGTGTAEASAAVDAAEASAAEVSLARESAHDGAPGGDQDGAGEHRTHTVRRGDTLAAIAEHYGVDVGELAELNDLDNPDLIYAGQVFRLPPA